RNWLLRTNNSALGVIACTAKSANGVSNSTGSALCTIKRESLPAIRSAAVLAASSPRDALPPEPVKKRPPAQAADCRRKRRRDGLISAIETLAPARQSLPARRGQRRRSIVHLGPDGNRSGSRAPIPSRPRAWHECHAGGLCR